MGNYNKWNRNEAETNPNTPIKVVLFVSRNKDNKELEGFSERRNAFVTTKSVEQLQPDFEAFVEKGLDGEFSRMYVSVNARSNEKTQKALLHQLIDNQYNMATMPQRIAALAAQKENALESKWLFDFDPLEDGSEGDTELLLEEFLDDVKLHHSITRTKKGTERPQLTVDVHKTPNGYAVVVDQRFDTRELLDKWTNVELKRDDLYCAAWATK